MDSKSLLYRCIDCSNEEIVSSYETKIDGRTCEKCKGHLIFIGPEKANDKMDKETIKTLMDEPWLTAKQCVGFIGVDLTSGPDRTAHIKYKYK